MAVAVTNSTISSLNVLTAISSNAATADTDALAEVFTITPTSDRILVVIGSTGSGADGNVTVSFAAGNTPQAKVVTDTLTKNTVEMIQLDTARVMKTAGTILLTLTPAATDKLKTDHAAYVKVYEMI